MNIGAHASIAGGVDNAVEAQRSYGGTCGQLFTTSPRVWQVPDIADDEAERFRSTTTAADIGPWVIHSSYLVNLATPKPDLREQSIANLQADIDAAATLEVAYVNTHLGAHTGAGVQAGLANAVSALDDLDVPAGVTLLIESDAGSGTKLGGPFEHLATVIERSEQNLAVCLDTAHAFVAGYDLSSSGAVEETVTEFDDVVGLDRLACVHLNDSKHGCGTARDEHAHIGEGEIGVEGMRAFLTHDAVDEIPLVLETPTEDDKSFAWNVDRARELGAMSA